MAPEPDSLTRRDLARILGLPEDAPSPALAAAARLLLDVLVRRREQANARGVDDASGTLRDDRMRRLEEEIAGLEAAVERWTATAQGAREEGARTDDVAPASAPRAVQVSARLDRMSLAGAMLGVGVMLVFLIAYAMGYRIERQPGNGLAAAFDEPARLILSGRMPGATLRIMDGDREELFVKTEAEGAVVELREGRYALDVSREDCPDRWTRSLYFEAGATHRFEPVLCAGEGRLTLRSNLPGDRLQIDGLDVEVNQSAPYRLGVGDHGIRLEKKGHLPFEAKVRISPDEELELRAELVAQGSTAAKEKPSPPPGMQRPQLDHAQRVQPAPFDLADLKQEIAPQKIRGQPSRLLMRAGLEGLPSGGSTAWHDRVSGELLGRFDSDGSGLIDRVEESDAIPCALWKEIELDFERGGLGLSMARYYGFDGSEWHDRALGFARGMRSVAYVKMRECGLTE